VPVKQSIIRRLERLEGPGDPAHDLSWIYWRGASIKVLRSNDVDVDDVMTAIHTKADREGREDETAPFSPRLAKWYGEAIKDAVADPDVRNEFVDAVNQAELRFFGRIVTENDGKNRDKSPLGNKIGR
jgi:hypothetical protein